MAEETVIGPPAPAGTTVSINLYTGVLAGRSVEYEGAAANEYIWAGEKGDVIRGNLGADTIYGNEGADEIYGGASNDVLIGGTENDTLFGDAENDMISGNVGNDVARGGFGDDTVYGGQGADTLFGDSGADILYGDLGNDVLWGGEGADRFVGRSGGGIDWIVDFRYAEGDRIQLAPGTLYTLSTVGGQVYLELGGGHAIGLVGVSYAQLGADFIVAG